MAAVSKDARYPAAIRGRQAIIVHRHLCLLYPVLATTRLPSDFSYFFLDFVTSNIRLHLAWDPHISLAQMRTVYFSYFSAGQPCWCFPGTWPLPGVCSVLLVQAGNLNVALSRKELHAKRLRMRQPDSH